MKGKLKEFQRLYFYIVYQLLESRLMDFSRDIIDINIVSTELENFEKYCRIRICE